MTNSIFLWDRFSYLGSIKGGSAASQWLPTNVTGTLAAWWDASDSLDVTGTTINSWADKSGNNRTLTATAMVTDTGRFGGVAVPRMASGALFTQATLVDPKTAFFVWSQDATITAASPNVRLIGTGTSTTGEAIGTGNGSAYLTNEILYFADGIAQFRGVDAANLPSGIAAGEHILCTRFTPFDIAIFLDGGADIQNIGAGGNTPVFNTGSLRVGEATGAATGHLAEVIIFSDTISLDDVDRVTGYLAHKWGLEANLPAEHPYKAAPPTS